MADENFGLIKNLAGGQTFSLGHFYLGGAAVTTPTIVAGDVLVMGDYSNPVNIATLPTAVGTSTRQYKQFLTQAETNYDILIIEYVDQTAPAEWDPMTAIISFGTNRNDEIATNAALAAALAAILAAIAAIAVSIANIPANVATAVWAAGARTLTSYGTLVADITTAVWGAAVRDLTTFGTLVADVVDAVWDELIAGHAGIGSFGESITDIPTDVWAAGTRTLTSLAGLACDLWACPTRTLTQALSTSRNISSTSIDIDAADYMELNISGLGDLTGRTKLWMTLKKSKEDVDASAWFQIEETAGLVYINGTAAGTPANGSITVTNVLRGDITVELDGVETLKLTNAEGKGYFDIKWINAAGKQLTLRRGKTTVIADITRAVA